MTADQPKITNNTEMRPYQKQKGKISGFASIITARNIYRFFGLLLFVVGAVFYLSWSILYGTWTDIGLYSYVVPLVVFGLLLLLLTHEQDRAESH
jgi:fatty acid desaturase